MLFRSKSLTPRALKRGYLYRGSLLVEVLVAVSLIALIAIVGTRSAYHIRAGVANRTEATRILTGMRDAVDAHLREVIYSTTSASVVLVNASFFAACTFNTGTAGDNTPDASWAGCAQDNATNWLTETALGGKANRCTASINSATANDMTLFVLCDYNKDGVLATFQQHGDFSGSSVGDWEPNQEINPFE